MSVAVICGGVGAARLLVGIRRVHGDDQLVAVANVGDDFVLHGLHISPDLDTITYTTAGAVSSQRGWGLEGETWQAMAMLGRYGGVDWFGLGDQDLGTHLYRTHRLGQGATLSEVTAEIVSAWDLGYRLLPVTNDRLATMITTTDGEISFQEYFVRLAHDVAVEAIRFDGAASATASPGVLEALRTSQRIVIAPSNPAVSIEPVLAVSGVRDILRQRRASVVAVSPIIGGRALKGPADRLLTELGHESSVVGVARWYRPLIGTLIIDEVDVAHRPTIEGLGINTVVMPTVMSTPEITDRLAEAVLS